MPDINELRPLVDGLETMLTTRVINTLHDNRRHVAALTRTLTQLSPRGRVHLHDQRLTYLTDRLQNAMHRRLDAPRNRIAMANARLSAISPLATLERGYAVVRSADGHVISSINAVAPGEAVVVQVADGTFDAQVTETR